MLKEIFTAATERRWKSGRRGGGKGDRYTAESEDGAEINGSRDDGKDTGDSQAGA